MNAARPGSFSPRSEQVKNVTKIYLQLKFVMKEDPIEARLDKSTDTAKQSVIKYARLLKRLYDICLVKMLKGQ